ncbi:MAG: FprA family A-type flavoprotein [Coriobacteriia bacterium]|nr:FprA family A-type flavoprotein [Coriobacteriia bacterium]MDI6843438.1 FprA family A-type flavoprotein [Anaerosomatales bacterium]
MRAYPIAEGIHWVGAIDWNLRDFHGYETPYGSTYNAYLVRGSEKTALVDTVKAPFVPELLARISSVMDPADVDLIVVNHVEPDHNGGLRDVMAAMPNARVVASPSGVKGVAEYHDGLAVDAVTADDVIDLGGRTLRFLPMPMVHWPDSMFTYCAESKTLMPNDAFGQHFASEERFADELGLDTALEQLGIYYANILLPLGTQVAKAVDKVLQTGWEIEVIAPSHGVAWRGADITAAIERYRRWTAGEKRDKAVVVYGTMWGSTAELAARVVDGLAQAGVEAAMYDVAVTPIAHIAHELLEAKALVLGSPTLHHGMLYRVSGLLTYLEGLRPAGRLAAAFGSFGWGGGAIKQMRERLEKAGFELFPDDFGVKFRPTADDLAAAERWGREIGEALRAR